VEKRPDLQQGSSSRSFTTPKPEKKVVEGGKRGNGKGGWMEEGDRERECVFNEAPV